MSTFTVTQFKDSLKTKDFRDFFGKYCDFLISFSRVFRFCLENEMFETRFTLLNQ